MYCAHPRERLNVLFATRDYITADKFSVAYCNDCRLYVTVPPPAPERVGDYYPAGYYGQGRRFNYLIEWLLRGLYSFRARQIEGKQRPGKVLDIGCGRGLLLAQLRDRGWEPYGTELSEESATYARDVLKLPVFAGSVEELDFADGEYDMVILWHVLEHVHSPQAMLREVSRLLKPGGTLLVAVPNFGSWEACMSGKYWFHLDVPRHLTHFTRKTLQQALNSAGMTVTSANFFSSEYDFYSFVQTVQNRLGLPTNLLYNLLRTRSAKVLNEESSPSTKARLQAALALLSAIPLAALSLLYAPIVAAKGRGATMAVYAVKRAPQIAG